MVPESAAEWKYNDTQVRLVIFTAVAAFIMMAVFLGVSWETNDDYAIAKMIRDSTEGATPFQHKWLTVALHKLYVVFPLVDWWLVMSLAALSAGMAGMLVVVFKEKSRLLAALYCLAVVFFIYVFAARTLNFTRTASVIAAGGTALIAEALFGSHCRCRISSCICGIAFCIWGAAIRYYSALLCLGFLAAAGFCYFVFFFFINKEKRVLFYVRSTAILLLVAVAVFSTEYIDFTFRSDREQQYMEYNSRRASVKDYESELPAWDEKHEEYASINISKNDLEAFKIWFHEDTDFFTVEKLKNLQKMMVDTSHDVPETVSWMFGKIKNSYSLVVVILLVITLSIYFCSGNLHYNSFKTFFLLSVVLAMCFFLSCRGRMPERVTFVIAVSCFFSYCILPDYGDGARKIWRLEKVFSKVSPAIIVVFLSILLSSVILFWQDTVVSLPEELRDSVNTQETCMDYLDKDKKSIYLLLPGTPENRHVWIWGMEPIGYCENVFRLGGWGARSPGNIDRLAERNITNPVKSLYLRETAYSLENAENKTAQNKSKIVLKYFREHYSGKITYSRLKIVDQNWIIKFQKEIKDKKITETGEAVLSDLEFFPGDEGYLVVRGTLSGNVKKKSRYYCNLTYGKTRYTYRVNVEENGDLSAEFGGITDFGKVKDDPVFFYQSGEDFFRITLSDNVNEKF